MDWTVQQNSLISSQVSDTENIRKNLAIERMIIEGCDILLDVNQMFVRQGTVIQVRVPLGLRYLMHTLNLRYKRP